jgi:hypothetical protein
VTEQITLITLFLSLIVNITAAQSQDNYLNVQSFPLNNLSVVARTRLHFFIAVMRINTLYLMKGGRIEHQRREKKHEVWPKIMPPSKV